MPDHRRRNHPYLIALQTVTVTSGTRGGFIGERGERGRPIADAGKKRRGMFEEVAADQTGIRGRNHAVNFAAGKVRFRFVRRSGLAFHATRLPATYRETRRFRFRADSKPARPAVHSISADGSGTGSL